MCEFTCVSTLKCLNLHVRACFLISLPVSENMCVFVCVHACVRACVFVCV